MSSKQDLAAAPERPSSTDIDAQCDQVELDFGKLCRQLVPILVNGVAATQGMEGAAISVTIGYKPGGQKSSRLGVGGFVKIPGTSSEHDVSIDGDGDERQFRLFMD